MEIEKKYLVKALPDLSAYPKASMEQGYISVSPVIRIRRSDSQYFLTIKGHGQIAREEHELEISAEEYQRLLPKVESALIVKDRYSIPISGRLTAELDIYHGVLSGLQTVEVEFSSLPQAEAFIPPDWFGSDVTLDRRYKNSSLSVDGLPSVF